MVETLNPRGARRALGLRRVLGDEGDKAKVYLCLLYVAVQYLGVTPAEAGAKLLSEHLAKLLTRQNWIPAFAEATLH